MTWGPREVWERRRAASRLRGPPLARPEDVVAHLAAVQSQEFAQACYSLGLRSAPTTYAGVRRAFDDGRFLRTHLLRPTWHFVAPADLRWLLRLTGPRVQARNASRYRQLGLDSRTLDRSAGLIVELLTGGNYLTRPEIGERLRAAGIDDAGQRQPYLLMDAELRGLVCSGPLRGTAHTYAPTDERVPAGVDTQPAEPEVELARRFVVGHGPVSVRDLSRWSSLTAQACRRALTAPVSGLERTEVDGVELWFDASSAGPPPASRHVHLLPLFDEAMLSFTAFAPPVVEAHPAATDVHRYVGSVVVDGRDVGSWRRTITGGRVEVETRLAPGLTARARRSVADQVRGLARFLELPLRSEL